MSEAAAEPGAPSRRATGSSRWKTRLLYPMALFYVAMGVLHFARTDVFVEVMPSWLPFPRELVWISGVAELGLGVARGVSAGAWILWLGAAVVVRRHRTRTPT